MLKEKEAEPHPQWKLKPVRNIEFRTMAVSIRHRSA